MKTKSLPVTASGTVVSNPFSWAKVHALALKLRAMLPAEFREILPVENVRSLKISLSLLAACIATILPPAVSLPIIVMLAYGNRHLFTSTKPIKKKGGKA